MNERTLQRSPVAWVMQQLRGFEALFVDLKGPDLRFQSRGRDAELGGRTDGAASVFSQGSLITLREVKNNIE
jgi:hypothetical protein